MYDIIKEADFIIENDMTIRSAAKSLSMSKSVLHRHLSYDLKKLDYEKYLLIKKIFLEHNKNKHIKGGQATKNKYLNLGDNNERNKTFYN